MARKYIDCREVPSEINCSVAIAADSEDELVEAAVQHAMAVHSHDSAAWQTPAGRLQQRLVTNAAGRHT